MPFRLGNGMCSMMAIMLMLSLLSAIRCGGAGVSTIHGVGDGVRHGIITVGIPLAFTGEVIGVDGTITIGITLIGIIITTTIHTMHGAV